MLQVGVEQVCRALSAQDVAYISMGSLRFTPALKPVVQARFPKNRLMSAELFPGADGKMRYFKPLRTEMYANMVGWIRRYMPATPIYLCMESHAVWRKVFGMAPACNADMEQWIQRPDGAGTDRQRCGTPVRGLPLKVLSAS